MPNPIRNIRIRFLGDNKSLLRSSKESERAIDSFQKQASKTIASNIGGGVLDALGALPSQLKGAAIVAGAGIGALIAPALGSAIISGVLLAVGGGVLAAGIVGAAKDNRVKKAWQKFADQGGKVFARFSQPFIKPLTRAADTFTRALRRADPIIQRIGRGMAPVIDRLAPAAVGFFEKLLPGIERASAASVPFLDQLALHAPRLGESLTKMFDAFVEGSPSAIKFFDRFLTFLEKALPKIGEFSTWLSDMGTKFENFYNSEGFQRTREALRDLKDNILGGLKSAWDDVSAAIDRNAGSWKTLKDAVNKALEILGPVVQASLEASGQMIAGAINAIAWLINLIGKAVEGLRQMDDMWRRITGKEPKNRWVDPPPAPSPTGFRGFAAGGRGRGWVMTGERGRELVNLGDGGRVYNNRDTEQMLAGGGGTTVIENHIHVGDEVVRVVRTVVKENNRALKRNVLAGAGAQ